jgi:hypothetical protein
MRLSTQSVLVVKDNQRKPATASALFVPASRIFEKGAGVLLPWNGNEQFTPTKIMSYTLLAVSYAFIKGYVRRDKFELIVRELRDFTDEFERNEEGHAE